MLRSLCSMPGVAALAALATIAHPSAMPAPFVQGGHQPESVESAPIARSGQPVAAPVADRDEESPSDAEPVSYPVPRGHPKWLSARDALARAESGQLSLELIMSDQRWVARSPRDAYFDDEGTSIYFRRDRLDEPVSDLYLAEIAMGRIELIEPEDLGSIPSPGVYSPDRRRMAYTTEGDLFILDRSTGRIRQLTRTIERESSPGFTADGTGVIHRVGDTWRIFDLESGMIRTPADVRTQDDPDAAEQRERDKASYLERQQERLFEHVRDAKHRERLVREHRRNERASNPARVPPPFYLGKDRQVLSSELSPSGRWLALRVAKRGKTTGKRDSMPSYATASGYVETRSVRSKVGTDKPRPETLVILDLEAHTQHTIDTSSLPGIADDPLAWLKQDDDKPDADGQAPAEPTDPDPVDADPPSDAPADARSDSEHADEQDEEPESKPRPIRFTRLLWSRDGQRLAFQAMSFDRKDRWIARVDLDAMQARPVEHLRDEAWINWRYNDIGFLPDDRTLWFLSERTGYSHLYVAPEHPSEPHDDTDELPPPLAVTAGEHVVDSVQIDLKGEHLYVRMNADHPGSYDVHRFDLELWRTQRAWRGQRITRLGGLVDYRVSPDGSSLLLIRSDALTPPELFVQPTRPGTVPRRVTTTVTDQFASLDWVRPRFVRIPSSHTDRPIHARLYRPGPGEANGAAVLFVHGAGYLQNAHKGWSRYQREFMFHTLLVQRGYTVLDMDYRASAGYGRDWRTAIYRRMGTPELQDLRDGVEWLAANTEVDRNRVGVYGGSYGGFLTLMAMFTEPDLFACGAALRPVTDWAHYNHGYTGNILNVPELDPEAYEISSPIEFAEGLEKPLLICHGMLDDNVFYQDTVRLAQRLIELGKEDWEVAGYPIEPHGFQTPSSWHDEYRRILDLFDTHLLER